MPILPELAMGIQYAKYESPDLLRLLLGASQIQQAQQQRQMQQFQMAQAVRLQQQEDAAQAYLKGRLQPVTPAPSMADQVPAAPAGTYTQPLTASQQLSAGTQAPEGTTYTRAPASMQPSAITSPPQPQAPQPIGWQEMVQFGKPGLAYAKLLQDAQDEEAKRKEAQMGLQMKALDHVSTLYGAVTDQKSLENANKSIGEIWPSLAATLPQTYDEKGIEDFRKRLVPMKQQLDMSRQALQLTPVWDPTTQQYKYVQAQAFGPPKEAVLPGGMQAAPPVKLADTGTALVPIGPGGFPAPGSSAGTPGAPASTGPGIPKQVAETQRQKTQAMEQAKYEEELRQQQPKARAAMEALNQKHALMTEGIKHAWQLVDQGWAPTTGVGGELAATVGVPIPRDLRNTLNTLKSQVGFDEFQALKEASAAAGARGSGLGPVSDAEQAMLRQQITNVEQSNSRPELLRNLGILAATLQQNRVRREQLYQDIFERRHLRPTPSARQQPRLEDIDAELTRRGVQ